MESALLWPKPSIFPDLKPDQVHVWGWGLGLDATSLGRDRTLLDPEELARMGRFRLERDQNRFAAAHGRLRRILGAYLQRPPALLQFQANAYGKPELAGPAAGLLHFSLSHAEDVALLAVAVESDVGVDVEMIRPVEEGVAESFFSPLERSQLASIDEGPRSAAWLASFYRCWTRKEAILKAEGVGLNVPLACFDVALLPETAAELTGARPEAHLTQQWRLHHLEPLAGSIGALAVAHAAEIRCFSFAPGG